MITLTIVKRSNVKGVKKETQSLEMFKDTDKARKFILPIAKEMDVCRQTNQIPSTEIIAVSYDTDSEKSMLLATRAIITTENE